MTESAGLTAIHVALARIEERQEAAAQAAAERQEQAAHRQRNFEQKLESLASRAALREVVEKIEARIEPIDKRVERLESTVTWVTRSILTAVVSAVAGLWALLGGQKP